MGKLMEAAPLDLQGSRVGTPSTQLASELDAAANRFQATGFLRADGVLSGESAVSLLSSVNTRLAEGLAAAASGGEATEQTVNLG